MLKLRNFQEAVKYFKLIPFLKDDNFVNEGTAPSQIEATSSTTKIFEVTKWYLNDIIDQTHNMNVCYFFNFLIFLIFNFLHFFTIF